MERLYAPWRGAYVTKDKKHDGSCVFCDKVKDNNDDEDYILHRAEHSFIVMNLYPYNNGHVMLIPYEHLCNYEDVKDECIAEINKYNKILIKVMKDVLRADGFNIGYNLHQAGGAGIAGHIHQHIVPRWIGDSNFMPVLAETKVISEHLDATYNKLKNELRRYL